MLLASLCDAGRQSPLWIRNGRRRVVYSWSVLTCGGFNETLRAHAHVRRTIVSSIRPCDGSSRCCPPKSGLSLGRAAPPAGSIRQGARFLSLGSVTSERLKWREGERLGDFTAVTVVYKDLRCRRPTR